MTRVLIAAVIVLCAAHTADAGPLIDTWKARWLDPCGRLIHRTKAEERQSYNEMIAIRDSGTQDAFLADRVLKFWGLLERKYCHR